MDPNETNEQNEEEKFEEAQGRDDNVDEDSDYFTFDRIRDMALRSEYGGELSRHDSMDESGNYKFETGDATNLEEIYKNREEIYNYFLPK